jgi:pimeloyl-ACP methyl ester carboxylesterase
MNSKHKLVPPVHVAVRLAPAVSALLIAALLVGGSLTAEAAQTGRRTANFAAAHDFIVGRALLPVTAGGVKHVGKPEPASAPAISDTVIDGQLGPGALYRLVRPANWNGRLFLYAHGAVSKSEPVALPAEADLIVGLLAPQGFAVAFSSFSENGWVVKDGAQRTHQLLGIFTSKFGSPARVYIGGASMGGLIAIKLLEQYPDAFAGALTVCPVAGGTKRQYDYFANTRALFDFFYPGTLPGNAGDVPPGTDVTNAVVLPAIAAMQTNPLNAFAIASIDQTPAPFSNPAELFESIATALGANAGSYNDLTPELHGKPYFDNRNLQYTSGALPAPLLAALNANVGRFDAAPSALNYMVKYYQPSGNLQIPMLMLSTWRDPVAPAFNQTAYLNLVTAAGHSDLLVQRSVSGTGNGYGHCTFTPTELGTAFGDLVGWVEFGFKPAP